MLILDRWRGRRSHSRMKDLRLAHRAALATAGEFIARVQEKDFDRPTPCAEWDLGALLAHMIGQNDGFARAVAEGDAEVNDYRAPMISTPELTHAWAESADRLTCALVGADLERPVRLVEVRPNGTVSVGAVVGIHLLDTVVHTWDVATSLRLDHRPPDDLINVAAAIAGQVPVARLPLAAAAPIRQAHRVTQLPDLSDPVQCAAD